MLRQGIACLREISTVEHIAFDADPSPDTPSQISEEEFADAVAGLVALGYEAERDLHEAYLHFRGWRANYEAMAYALADRVYAVPAPWSGERHPSAELIFPTTVTNRTPSGLSAPPAGRSRPTEG